MDSSLRITVVYDNHPPESGGLKASWGFACVIEGLNEKILFDTGASGPILMHNLAALGFRAADFDCIAISHGDWDHLGGIWNMLDENPHIEVFLPASLSSKLKNEIGNHGATVIPVGTAPLEITPRARLTGEMEGPRNETALILETAGGPILITGCAHPGIVEITARCKELCGKTPLLVMGGFHLGNLPGSEVVAIAEELLKLGVRNVAPTHCSGPQATEILSSVFGKPCLGLGAGTVINTKDLS